MHTYIHAYIHKAINKHVRVYNDCLSTCSPPYSLCGYFVRGHLNLFRKVLATSKEWPLCNAKPHTS